MAASTGSGSTRERKLRVMLYSDNADTRAAVRLAVGRRPASDLPVVEWFEVATHAAAVDRADSGTVDVMVLDGEAAPSGGMGLCRQLKNEIYRCPPVLVLTGPPSGRVAGDVVAGRRRGAPPARPAGRRPGRRRPGPWPARRDCRWLTVR